MDRRVKKMEKRVQRATGVTVKKNKEQNRMRAKRQKALKDAKMRAKELVKEDSWLERMQEGGDARFSADVSAEQTLAAKLSSEVTGLMTKDDYRLKREALEQERVRRERAEKEAAEAEARKAREAEERAREEKKRKRAAEKLALSFGGDDDDEEGSEEDDVFAQLQLRKKLKKKRAVPADVAAARAAAQPVPMDANKSAAAKLREALHE